MEHTRFVGLDIHKERISIAVAESGRTGAVEYLSEISNDPVAIGKLCDRLKRPGKTLAFCYEADLAALINEYPSDAFAQAGREPRQPEGGCGEPGL